MRKYIGTTLGSVELIPDNPCNNFHKSQLLTGSLELSKSPSIMDNSVVIQG